MTTFLGIDVNVWIIILTAIVVIETLVLIFLTIIQRKSSGGFDPTTARLFEKILEKVPTLLDMKEVPFLLKEDIRRLEEKTPFIGEMKGLFDLNLLIKLGNIEYIQGNLQIALTYFNEALKKAKYIGDSKNSSICLSSIGLIHKTRGDPDTALEYYQEALEINRDIGYKEGEATDLGNIGNAYRDKGDLDNTLRYYQEALQINRDIGNRKGEAIDLGNIGIVYRDKGDPDTALEYYQEALEIN